MMHKIESKIGKLTVTHGDKHEFLGLAIVLSKNDMVTIGMSSYMEQTLHMFG